MVEGNISPQESTPISEPVANAGENYAFQADVARLLHTMVHSVYSDRAIFLRELISNAADACEKLRFEALSRPELTSNASGYSIRIEPNKARSQLAIQDNGIGMSRDELIKSLGTIAHSGTREYLAQNRSDAQLDAQRERSEDRGEASLIGQFGVGFYSAFMVADAVEVISRRAGGNEIWKWYSDGKGTYRIEPATGELLSNGTRVILSMKDDAKEFLEPYRLEQIIREHAAAIQIPIELVEHSDGEPRQVTDGAALWTRSKGAITKEEYTKFYQEFARQFDEPALTIHWRAEGRNEYTVLAFIPGSRPLDLFDPARKGRAKLYVRRVLINEDADLLPAWLRFARILVDAADIPLNLSRELVQKSPVLGAIKKAVTNRILQELSNLAKNDREKFDLIWKNFGAVIKEGLYEDPERRDQIFELARFHTTKSMDELRTLADYVSDLKTNQTAIYYIVGENQDRLAASPQLEGFRARDVEVLLLNDPVDAFWTTTALGFQGKPFKSITQGTSELKDIESIHPDAATEAAEPGAQFATLLAFAKQTLQDVVADVCSSDKLSESPACLVASATGMDRRLERILAEHGRLQEKSKPILELNPRHALITRLSERLQDKSNGELVEDAIWMLFDEARMIEGEGPSNPIAFRQRLFRLIAHKLD